MSVPPEIRATQRWLEQAVIGLNLCPFAKAVHVQRKVRWVLSPARTRAALLQELVGELMRLAAADPAEIDTTLIVHPRVLVRFADFNDFSALAEAAVEELGLAGTLQVASFHPRFRFEGHSARDIANATNRSPYPTLHLLREDSIARAVAAVPDAEAIWGRNVETMRALGDEGWRRLMSKVQPGSAGAKASAAASTSIVSPTSASSTRQAAGRAKTGARRRAP